MKKSIVLFLLCGFVAASLLAETVSAQEAGQAKFRIANDSNEGVTIATEDVAYPQPIMADMGVADPSVTVTPVLPGEEEPPINYLTPNPCDPAGPQSKFNIVGSARKPTQCDTGTELPPPCEPAGSLSKFNIVGKPSQCGTDLLDDPPPPCGPVVLPPPCGPIVSPPCDTSSVIIAPPPCYPCYDECFVPAPCPPPCPPPAPCFPVFGRPLLFGGFFH